MSDTGVGRSHFVAQHDLWDEKQQIAAREVEPIKPVRGNLRGEGVPA